MPGKPNKESDNSLSDRETEFENITPKGKEFVKETFRQSDNPEFQGTTYGHSMVNLAVILRDKAVLGHSQEEQLEFLRNRALKLVQEFGPNILNVMRDELKLALTDEDLASFDPRTSS